MTPEDALAPAVARATAAASASRARQLRWVASELALFTGTLPPTDAPTTAAGLLAERHVAAYLAAADHGLLRRRGTAQRPSTDASRRVRRACLRLLAEAAGLPDPVGDEVALPPLRARADDLPAGLAVAHWSGQAVPATARPADVRIAAMAALIHAAGLRSGELAALVPGDLDLAAGTLTYQPRPPAARTLPPPRTVPLPAPTVRLLRHWLEVRAALTERTPRTRSLWVSLAANHDGFGTRRPAGMPLQPTGLRRAYARAVAAVNFELAGSPGFAPLPRNPGLLRRPDEQA